ncbi:hypothetical protein JOC78_000734 [Bacillus ectoiniformans]|nr:hypothetical protein [Bacillus ectoiniformans]
MLLMKIALINGEHIYVRLTDESLKSINVLTIIIKMISL